MPLFASGVKLAFSVRETFDFFSHDRPFARLLDAPTNTFQLAYEKIKHRCASPTKVPHAITQDVL